MKRPIVTEIILILALVSFSVFAQGNAPNVNLTKFKYINVDTENLRMGPNDKVIGTALKGTTVQVIQETDEWALVQMVAWIWKGSLTNVKPDVLKGEYHALHIMVSSRDQAESILRDLRNGKKEFSAAAKEYSIAPSAQKGGDLGYFNKGDFSKEFEDAILKLKTDEISEVVQTPLGFNIFKRIK